MRNRFRLIVNRITACVLVMCFVLPCLPAWPGGSGWFVSDAFADEGTAAQAPSHAFSLSPEPLGEELTDGEWRYALRQGDGYAIITYYLGKDTHPCVPASLAGADVVGIASGALGSAEAVTLHGNILLIADDAFGTAQPVLHALNGSYSLYWAAQHGFEWVNTSVGVFTPDVVDYSDAPVSRVRRMGNTYVKLGVLEAQRLSVGSLFWMEDARGTVFFYRVTDLIDQGSSVLAAVEVPDVGDVVQELELTQSIPLTASDFTPAEGVIVNSLSVASRSTATSVVDQMPVSVDIGILLSNALGSEWTSSTEITGSAGTSGSIRYTVSVKNGELVYYSTTENNIIDVSMSVKPKVGYDNGFPSVKAGRNVNLTLGKTVIVTGFFTASFSFDICAELEGCFSINYQHVSTVVKEYDFDGEEWVVVDEYGTEKVDDESVYLATSASVRLYAQIRISLGVFKIVTVLEVVVKGGVEFLTEASSNQKCMSFVLRPFVSIDVFAGLWVSFGDNETGAKVPLYTKSLLPVNLVIANVHVCFEEPRFHFAGDCPFGETCTVTFDPRNGQEVETIVVVNGFPIGNAEAPKIKETASSGEFLGWSDMPEATEPNWEIGDLDGDLVTKNMKLYGVWANCAEVTFYTQGGVSVPTQRVPVDGYASEPTPPVRSGYTFVNWYCTTADGGQRQWDFQSDPVPAEGVTLYALWRNDSTGETNDSTGTARSMVIGDKSFSLSATQSGAEYFEYNIVWLEEEPVGFYITGLKNSPTHVLVPSSLTHDFDSSSIGTDWRTLPVMGVSPSTFSNRTSLVCVDFDVTLSDDYFDGMFSGCTSLQYADIRRLDLTEVPDSMFSGCTSLVAAALPAGINAIGDSAFRGCTSLPSVDLISGIDRVGNFAFSDCPLLTDIGYGDVSILGYMAFGNCTGLTELYIPDHVTTLQTRSHNYGPFTGCTNVRRISVGGVSELSYYSLYTNSPVLEEIVIRGTVGIVKEMSNDLKDGKHQIRLTIEEGSTQLAEGAFGSCVNITELTLPSSLTTIPANAFNNCTGLTSLRIPDGTLTIGGNAFSYCSNITSLDLGETVVTIDINAFNYCTGLTDIYIPDSVRYLKSYSHDGGPFDNCTSVRSLSVGGVTTLTSLMITTESRVLETIAVRGTVDTIGSFSYDVRYQPEMDVEVIVEQGVKAISDQAFYQSTGMVSIKLPASLTSLGTSAFSYCTRLADVNWEGLTGLTRIGNSAFYACTSLHRVSLPDSIQIIGSGAFEGCTGIEMLNIGTGVHTIEANAFSDCTGLTSIFIPDNVKTLGVSGHYDGPFTGCTNVREVSVGGVPMLTTLMVQTNSNKLERIIFRGTTPHISSIPADLKNEKLRVEVIIMDGVTTIDASCFSSCDAITKLRLPNTLSTIPRGCFTGCVRLSEITIPDGVITISNNAFYGCTGLKKLNLGNGVQNIGVGAFRDCTGLTELYIPDSMRNLQVDEPYYGPFYGCKNIRRISVGGVDTIGKLMLRTDSNVLEEIVIRGTVRAIGDGAFCGSCYGMENTTRSCRVIIEEGVESIGAEAFYGCTSISELILPGTLTKIGRNAFYRCAGLKNLNIHATTSGIANAGIPNSPSLTVHMVGENDGMRTYFTGLKSTVVLAGETVYALTLCAGEGRFQDGTAQCSLSLAWQDPLTDLPVPENGDKLFCGWYKDADCTKPYTEETMPASDLNLYAGWDIDVYTVTLNLMGGEMDHPLVFRARAGTQPVAALVPALTDRSFTGWYTDRYATTLFSGVMPACDVTLYAGYIKSGLNGEYSVANGEATLIRYQMVEHENTTLYLPETVDGVPLTGIAAGAFSGEAVEVLYLPASLTYIDPRAFSGMGNLARFEVRPGSNAFTAVDGVLYSLDGSTIVHYPPQHGTVFTMPAVVTSVGAYAFADAPLTAVNFSAALQNIGSHAFSGTALRSVTLPDSVRVIDDYAFSGCSALSLVMFDGEPESIGSDCFFGSSGQMMVFGPVYGADGVTLSVPADYAKANQISYNYYTLTLISDSANHWQVQTGQPMELPDDAEVGENAYFGGWYTSADFSGEPVSADALMPQSSLTLYAKAVPVYAYERVTADDGTQTLMITAWDPACGDIAPVVPGSIDGVDVTAIAAGCFPMDAMSITVPECVTTLSDGWVPEGWSGEIIAPAGSAAAIWAESNGLTVAAPLYKLSFVVNGGAGIESVAVGAGALLTLPEPVRTGYDFALWHMDEALTTVAALDEYGQYTMPAADTVLYASWVMNDESAATLSFTYIETMDGTITITGLAEGTTALVIPETLHGLPVTAIADHAFAYETELISVVIPGSIVAIPDSAFTGCSALTGVVLSEGVQTLGKDCFSMCTALATIDLPATLTTIGSGALRSTAITGLHLPVGLTSIASDALNGCRSLAAITVAEGNAFYASIDGVLYDLVDAKLVRYPAARAGSVYAVDDTACVIGSHAFAGAKLSTITLPETVLSLEEGAFAGFTALTQLPGFTSSLLTMIPDSAFAGCRGLTEIVIPDTIVSIGDGAFSDCTLLRAATIPVSVVSIGAKAFDPTVILYGTSGSAAEAYADEYGLLFIDPDVTVLPDCITLSVDAMTLARGETAVLTAALLPENATETSIIWYSSDNSVVSVSSDGALRALSSGEAVVTAATLNGLSASCTVTVTSGIPVDSITLNTGAIFLSEGSQEQLNAYLMPANATELDLMWYSDDEGVATVNDVGLVNAVSGGTTTIRATTMSGLTAMCSVTVPIRVQELTLSCPGTFYPGDTAAVTALITPVDAYDQSLIWSVSPASLATISADGMVSFLAPGYVTVTATAADYGTVTASLELECLADKVYILPAALTVIADEAFAGTPLQCVVIPDGVISIGANAFAGCTGLYKAVIPEDVAFIDDTAFAGCTLTIVAPEGSYAHQWALNNGMNWRSE